MGINLIYNGYRIGCYNAINSGNLVYFIYGNSTYMACYFADLKPNTTYTIKRIGTSTRFRIATYTEDVKMLIGSGNNNSIVQQWVIDSSTSKTFTTGENDIYLCIYYTNDSEYDTKVMLNEGTEIEDYVEPTLKPPWYWKVINGNFNMPLAVDIPSESISPEYPKALMRKGNNPLTSYIEHPICAELDNEPIQSVYPKSLLRIHDGTISNKITDEYSKLDIAAIVPTYPKAFWRINTSDSFIRSKVYNGLFLKDNDLGAFNHNSNLANVTFPKSLESIGKYCATNTQLHSVKIPEDCNYYKTSFPDGCEVKRF